MIEDLARLVNLGIIKIDSIIDKAVRTQVQEILDAQ
jgi:hypothetical protein